MNDIDNRINTMMIYILYLLKYFGPFEMLEIHNCLKITSEQGRRQGVNDMIFRLEYAKTIML